MLRRRKWIIVVAIVVAPVVAYLLSARQAPSYQASAQVFLSNSVASLTGAPDQTAAPDVQAELARTREIARRVLGSLHMSGTSPDSLLGASSVAVSNDDILVFTVNNADPTTAVRLAGAYARQYASYSAQLDRRALEAARAQLAQRIATLKATGQGSGALYRTLVANEEHLRTLEALETSNTYMIEAPNGASRTGPHPSRDAILGLMLGIGLGVALALLRETLDTRVRSAVEISERLGLTLLARIPEPPRSVASAKRLVMIASPGGREAEAFRMLRTNLEFSLLDRDIRTIMVTSGVEEEGKTTTAANLAIALARAGQRAVLLDLDLRRPSIGQFFDLRGRPGLTQVVLGHARLADALVSVPFDPSGEGTSRNGVKARVSATGNAEGQLLVVGAGPIPPNPGEFVTSHGLDLLLAELRDVADVVVIDVPPLLHVGDAMSLSGRVDAVLMIARIQIVRRPMLSELRRLVETMPAAKLGIVVTGADSDEAYADAYGAYGSRYYREQVGHESRLI